MENVERPSSEESLVEPIMDDLFPVEHAAEQVAEELRMILSLPLETPEQQNVARERIRQFTALHTRWSPNFFNDLPLEEKLSLLRATYRHPLANRYLYQSFSGELGYEVTFYGEQFRAAVFDTAKDPLSRCENVSVYLHLAVRDEGYNERAQRAMRQTLQRLANEGSPLERIVATAALFRLERSAHDDRRLLPAETARELLNNIEQNHRDDIARTEQYTVENPLEEERDFRAIAADALATFS